MRSATRLLILPALLAMGCVAGQVDDSDADSTDAPLVNASVDTTHLNVYQIRSVLGPQRIEFCTGTLVAPHTVLTAAHCIVAAPDQTFFVVDEAHKYRGRTTAIHPDYRLGDPLHDIALITLTDDVPGIEPAWLLWVPPIAREALTLVGYGVNDDGVRDDVRRSGTTTISAVRSTDLYSRYTYSGRPVIVDGDSGGPAFVMRGDRERLTGVASKSTGECHILFVDCTDNQHTRVDLNYDWIVSQMDEPLYDGSR